MFCFIRRGIFTGSAQDVYHTSDLNIMFLFSNHCYIFWWSMYQTAPCTEYRGTLQWRHNGRYGVSNHQPHDCLLDRLFGRRSTKTPKLRVTGLCVGNLPGIGEFPAQMASNAEKVSIWWRHHEWGQHLNCKTVWNLLNIKTTFILCMDIFIIKIRLS